MFAGAIDVGLRGGICGSLMFVNGTYFAAGSHAVRENAGGAAIGCSGPASVGSVTISGGNITAEGPLGIGTGAVVTGTSSIGNVTILSGNVNATAQVGIGAAPTVNLPRETTPGERISHVGNIGIFGGNVTAAGEDGAGIGCGAAADNPVSVDSLNIVGGNVNATGRDAAGIGSGYSTSSGEWGISIVGDLTIVGGNIRAASLAEADYPYNLFRGSHDQGAGIGSGPAYNAPSMSSVTRLRIVGGNITATGTDGAGIGSGYSGGGADRFGVLPDG